ncbi:peptide chain release factor N(5)-glutamine methyltransferase [Segniliparus rugosus]|uniref:Release factor glutamine methyltransferase n=1 Tax=Segniliparus rugosus (strain ATCC BAA-974 / DSM 45345 / CCUG 50838 / CIP 108380 / JCM 13579 / CDC 945) TaxID=679197 RepID=E5XLI8_SEGRC|nr:peptide chain release factor N(5)-glutamine methyltransferase [Segniliparus rugosus]EFV14761.1 protein-(glutamine-N5) methyltransferase, release factor-specific [Segniliparus rugosus ATCC BAA-974]
MTNSPRAQLPSLREELRAAEQALRAAGVPSPEHDARVLAAHVLGVKPGFVWQVDSLSEEQREQFDWLVVQRSRRVPLQYLLGKVFFASVEVLVGPGVFIPRPETEQLHVWALTALRARLWEIPEPVVFDLCSGSGSLGLSIAHSVPESAVTLVENDPKALVWTHKNVQAGASSGRAPVRVVEGDVTDQALLPDGAGTVDLVVANPPYVPSGTPTPPEVADFDPPQAVFAGPDGLDVIVGLVGNIARWLKPGGAFGVEHDEGHADQVRALFAKEERFREVKTMSDLAGRPRFVTGRRA